MTTVADPTSLATAPPARGEPAAFIGVERRADATDLAVDPFGRRLESCSRGHRRQRCVAWINEGPTAPTPSATSHSIIAIAASVANLYLIVEALSHWCRGSSLSEVPLRASWGRQCIGDPVTPWKTTPGSEAPL